MEQLERDWRVEEMEGGGFRFCGVLCLVSLSGEAGTM
jgi:hypothetical protein